MIGSALDVIIPARLRQRHWDGFRAAMARGSTKYGEDDLLAVPAIAADGRTVSIEFSIVLVANSGGGISHVGAIIRDVSAGWAAEQETRSGVWRLSLPTHRVDESVLQRRSQQRVSNIRGYSSGQPDGDLDILVPEFAEGQGSTTCRASNVATLRAGRTRKFADGSQAFTVSGGRCHKEHPFSRIYEIKMLGWASGRMAEGSPPMRAPSSTMRSSELAEDRCSSSRIGSSLSSRPGRVRPVRERQGGDHLARRNRSCLGGSASAYCGLDSGSNTDCLQPSPHLHRTAWRRRARCGRLSLDLRYPIGNHPTSCHRRHDDSGRPKTNR